MINNKRVLAFIGARSGSKGLMDKNIKLLHGLPLIAWTIKAAKASRYIDEVVFSSDSEQYNKLAEEYGATSIQRPAELADDNAALIDAIKHAHVFAKARFDDFDIIINLQPTSPLRNETHIDQALTLFMPAFEKNTNARLFSCYQVSNKYAWIMRINEAGYSQFIDADERNKVSHGRQKNPTILLPNGAIFILPATDTSQFYNEKTVAYIMDEHDSIDIDSAEDFALAEQAMEP
jgi:CMP-N,N'-diacetyllegionaminic acid synthase